MLQAILQRGDIDSEITVYAFEPFTFDMPFGVCVPVGKVAGYEPDNGSWLTENVIIIRFPITFKLTRVPIQYILEVREPQCRRLTTSVVTSFYTVVSTFFG